jgi:RHS repeat-associated protein
LWSGGAETTPLDGTANADHLITTTYEYNNNSQLKKIIDDSSQNTIYEYDNQGRPKKITYQDNSYKELTYNVDSLVTKWTQVKSSSADLVVNRQFDALHRLVQKDRVPSTPFVGTKQQLFQYDGLSRLTKAMDDLEPGDPINSQVEMSYDSFGDVLTEKQTAAYDEAAPATYLVTSEYNGVGFRTKLTYPGGRAIDYHPDELNRLESLDDEYLPQGSRTTSYDYLGGSKILNRRAPNNTSIRVTYDDAKRVVELAHSMTSGTPPYALPDFKYGYDIVGNRLSERRLHEPSTGSNKKGERYEYDVAYRLTKRREGSFDTNGAWQDTWPTALDYNLDGPGNWKTYLNGTSYTNTVNTLNQYSVFRGNGANRNLLYDLAGNLIRESMTAGGQTVYQQYSYDSSNRLNSYTDTSENATEYKYDALNRRIMKNWHASTYRRFVYDGGKLIEERDYYDNLMASYVYGAGGEILTRRHWFGGSSTDLFYHTNSLGSVTAVTDSAGEVKERYKYDSYGKATFVKPDFSASGSTSYLVVANNILFSGAYYDGESGNYYMWHREYDPYLGRFLQRDPLGEGESLNLYAYVHNNPINATDPTGLAQERGQTWFNLVTGGGGAGSRNIYCMAGLCGGGSASSPWPIGWTSSGAPIYAPSNQSSYFGSFAHLHDLTAARADVLHARAELGLPAGDPDRGMNGDGTQPSDGSNSGSRTGMDIWDSVSKRWSTVTETADMFSKDMNRAADILTQPLTDWLNRHCLMCPAPPSLFRPPAMKLGIIFLPFGGVAKGSMSLARELGAAGEAAVREAVEIGPATRVVVNGATRVPDGLTSTALSEVKNVGALSFTQQLRDYAQIAGEMEVRFDLYVRPGAALSGPLLEAEAAGIVNILPIPFK